MNRIAIFITNRVSWILTPHNAFVLEQQSSQLVFVNLNHLLFIVILVVLHVNFLLVPVVIVDLFIFVLTVCSFLLPVVLLVLLLRLPFNLNLVSFVDCLLLPIILVLLLVVLLVLLMDHVVLVLLLIFLLLILLLIVLFPLIHLLVFFAFLLAFNLRLVRSVLRVFREIRSRSIQPVIVIGTNQKFALLLSEMLVWIHASLS